VGYVRTSFPGLVLKKGYARSRPYIYDNVVFPAETSSRMPLRHIQQCAVFPDVEYVSKEARGKKHALFT